MTSYFRRKLEPLLQTQIDRNQSVLLLGPRQVGKSTLLKQVACALRISLVSPRVRAKYERDPALLADEIRALPRPPSTASGPETRPVVIIDEIQKIPKLMDVAQEVLDDNLCMMILTGSSARRLRRGDALNLLPGRVHMMRLDPLLLEEDPNPTTPHSITEHLHYGALPGVRKLRNAQHAHDLLASYVETYLQEEIREEALVRNVALFSRFLELACIEAGQIVNFTKIASEIGGVSAHTIQNYYEILEDCLVAERVDPITKSVTRKKLTKSSRYLIFDLGVRRLGAREGVDASQERLGQLFEQWVGLETIRWLRLFARDARLGFWRDPDGPEVDWVVQRQDSWLPIEVKWTERPTLAHIKHLEVFMNEYPQAREALVVCRCDRPLRLSPRVKAVPWTDLLLELKNWRNATSSSTE